MTCCLNIFILFAFLDTYTDSKPVVGGIDAVQKQFPYQISLQRDHSHICGGSIIHTSWILTAAHCVEDTSVEDLSIVAGTTKLDSGGIRKKIKTIIIHEGYKGAAYNDIALLELEDPVPLNSSIRPVVLSRMVTLPGTNVIFTGWGYNQTKYPQVVNDLQYAEVKTITNEQCIRDLNRSIPIEDICTIGKIGRGFCQGDSGGPLVNARNKQQVGIISGNVPCAKGYPDIYTGTCNYRLWIYGQTKLVL